ncbi:hypothetical protein SAG0169_09545 [Streptococcus agalactiae LDS 610]|nr:hypothetical protein SAG0169_09545 [Streptococcus agalactiae LDS 610]MBE3601750.1 hypothetical protein [Streptococcus agalactiae]
MVNEIFYFVGSRTGNRLIHRITQQEYSTLKRFNDDFIKFSNVVDCYNNFLRSRLMIEEYVSVVETHSGDMEKIYSELKFLMLTNILLGRLFFDNCKSFTLQLKLMELKEQIKKYEQNNEIKVLKILRDFGQHFSIPVDNLQLQTDLIREKTSVEIYVSKSELERNKGANKQNDKFISKMIEGEIALLDSFKKWSLVIDQVFFKLKRVFYQQIPLEIKNLLEKYFEPVIMNSGIYRPDFISIEVLDQSNISLPDRANETFNTYRNIEFTRYSRNALEELLVSVENKNI